MRATQHDAQEKIHEEEDEMRTANAKDNTNEKGKRKLDKHEALCEPEHRKRKKKNRHNNVTNKSVNSTGRPTPCGQTPGKR